MEKEVIRRRKDLLQMQQKQQASQKRTQQMKLEVIADLRPHAGPCSTLADHDHLLQSYTTVCGLKKALRAEIFFQKLVLNKKSPFLKVTGSPLTLLNRLRQFLGGEILDQLSSLQPPVHHLAARTNKRARQEVSESEGSDTEADSDDSEEEVEGHVYSYQQFAFKFTQEGEVVAVYYEDDFFIGEVDSVVSEEEAEVNFMAKSQTTKRVIFKWPCTPDRCPVSSSVVFAGNLRLVPASSSGRAFVVDRPDNLPARYEAFKCYLFENLL